MGGKQEIKGSPQISGWMTKVLFTQIGENPLANILACNCPSFRLDYQILGPENVGKSDICLLGVAEWEGTQANNGTPSSCEEQRADNHLGSTVIPTDEAT